MVITTKPVTIAVRNKYGKDSMYGVKKYKKTDAVGQIPNQVIKAILFLGGFLPAGISGKENHASKPVKRWYSGSAANSGRKRACHVCL
jgi:hypothetical protein